MDAKAKNHKSEIQGETLRTDRGFFWLVLLKVICLMLFPQHGRNILAGALDSYQLGAGLWSGQSWVPAMYDGKGWTGYCGKWKKRRDFSS